MASGVERCGVRKQVMSSESPRQSSPSGTSPLGFLIDSSSPYMSSRYEDRCKNDTGSIYEDRHKNDTGSICGDSSFIIGYISCPIFINFTHPHSVDS